MYFWGVANYRVIHNKGTHLFSSYLWNGKSIACARASTFYQKKCYFVLTSRWIVLKMLPFTPDEKAQLVKFYLETKSVVLTQRKWKKCFKARKAPSRKAILSLTEQFLGTGSLESNKQGRCGAKRTKRTPATAQKARQIMSSAPKMSLKQLSQQLRCSYSTAQRIARTDLKLRPYKITIHQKLRDCGERSRKRYCAWLSRKCHTSI